MQKPSSFEFSSVSGKFLLRLELLIAAFLVSFLGYFLEYLSIHGYSIQKGLMLSSFYLLTILGSLLNKRINQCLKYLKLLLYIASLLLVIFISFQNGFNERHFYALILIYLFFSFVQERVKHYLFCNLIVITALIAALLLSEELKSEHALTYFLSFMVVFIIGTSVTYSRENVKRKLVSRKSLLNYIFNMSSEGLLLVDQHTQTISDCNDKALEILRFTDRKSIKGKELQEVEFGGKKIFKGRLKEHERQAVELNDKRILNFSLKPFNFFSSSFWLVDLKLYTNQLDFNISEEYNMMISASEDNYRYLFEESSSMICIIDKAGLIKDVNQTLLKELGYSKEDLIGKKYDVIDAEYYPQRILSNQKALDGDRQEFEKTIVDSSGRKVEIEVILRKGKYFGEEVLISNSRDISNRKHLEKQLAYNTYRYRKLFELSPICIVIIDNDRKAELKSIIFLSLSIITIQIGDNSNSFRYR
jgi:PAS domain S-box-containing protein